MKVTNFHEIMTFRYLFRPLSLFYILLHNWFASGPAENKWYPKRRIIEESLIRVWSKCVTRAKKTRTSVRGGSLPIPRSEWKRSDYGARSSSSMQDYGLRKERASCEGINSWPLSSVLQSLISGFHWPNPTGSPRTREAVNVIFSVWSSGTEQKGEG